MYKQWSSKELDFLSNNYKTMTNREIAEFLGRTKTAVDLKINKMGLKKTKYKYDENFFENIDTEEKAYWLGFIYADGYIINGVVGNKYYHELGVELQEKDYTQLKKFNKSIRGNLEIKYRTRICNLSNKAYNTCFIKLYSKKIVEDLQRQGVFLNKSLIIKLPKLTDNLMPHFIRGFFDGDGCLVKNNHKNGKSYIRADFTCGSNIFINQLREYLYKNNIKSYISKEKNKPYRLLIGGMVNCDIFLKYIYNNANIYLDRKYYKKISLYEELNINERIASLK